MPEAQDIVVNTSPLIALVAATGNLDVLRRYRRVYVPLEVCREIEAGGVGHFALTEFQRSHWLQKQSAPIALAAILENALDRGEASVIQFAMDRAVQTVCIDDHAGRRLARLSGLKVTGSLGILIKAKIEGYPVLIAEAIARMQQRGIWLSERLIVEALRQAGELPTNS